LDTHDSWKRARSFLARNLAELHVSPEKFGRCHNFPTSWPFSIPFGKRSQKAVESCPVEIVDLPSYKMVDLSIVIFYVYQRENHHV
jgi:hypothetical protein